MRRRRPGTTAPPGSAELPPLPISRQLDEAEAILRDVEGTAALHELWATAARNRRSQARSGLARPAPSLTPLLGIFWFLPNRHGRTQLLAHTYPLASAEEYGDCLTSPAGHYETWTAWRRGRPKPPLPALAPLLGVHDYEHWPRGRIVFHRPTSRFVLYMDRQLLGKRHLTQITTHFCLPPTRTIVRTDPHYQSRQLIGRR